MTTLRKSNRNPVPETTLVSIDTKAKREYTKRELAELFKISLVYLKQLTNGYMDTTRKGERVFREPVIPARGYTRTPNDPGKRIIYNHHAVAALVEYFKGETQNTSELLADVRAVMIQRQKDLKLTVRAWSQHCNISEDALQKFLNNQWNVSLSVLENIAAGLDVKIVVSVEELKE